MSKKVKGVFFLDYVRMLKRAGRSDWSDYLNEEDLVYFEQDIKE